MKTIFAKVVREMMIDAREEGRKLTQNDFAKALGTSRQSFSNKILRDTFTVEDACEIADYFGYELVFRKKGNKENEYIIKKGG